MDKKRGRPATPQLPPLAELPLDLAALDKSVHHAFRAATAALDACHSEAPAAACLSHANAAVDAAREATFPFLEEAESAAEHSKAYAVASLWWAEVMLLEHAVLGANGATQAAAALRACDLALLRAGMDEWSKLAEPLVDAATELARLSTSRAAGRAAEAEAEAEAEAAAVDAVRAKLEAETPHHRAAALARPIPRVDASTLTVGEFEARYMRADPPRAVILVGALRSWPALSTRPWRDLEYLKRSAGERLVPVETCAAAEATQGYLSSSWERRVMSLADYIETYVCGASASSSGEGGDGEGEGGEGEGGEGERGYLAQHQLFDQIPSLVRTRL